MTRADGFELKGGHVAFLFFGFFAVVIGVNALFITLAVRTFPGEVVPKSYVQGLRYNETLAARAAGAALGWRAGAAFEGDALVVTMRDAAGRPLEDLTIAGDLRRPADARFDRALAFAPLGGGRYRAATPALAPGQWELKLAARRGDQALEIGGRLEWTP